MAITYEQKKHRQNNLLYTVITVILLCAIFSTMVGSFYIKAENEAYEMLHIQTKQIKDNLTLQLNSDRENLFTMASFAANLYSSGEDYDIMFSAFKPIGLFSNIGILKPDNTFVTRVGSIDLNGKISFEEEAARGEYISGRIPDLTRDDAEIIRSAVPIKVNGETVGILYGVIHLKTIGEKYTAMAKELDAQLFVYDKETGKFVIDTIDRNPGELSELKTREYSKGYSYNDFITNESGFSSFKSIFTGEILYTHYSTIEDFDWGIMLARYESQVFADTHNISRTLLITFIAMAFVIVIYLTLILRTERNRSKLNRESSDIRRLLLEINNQNQNMTEALKNVKKFTNGIITFFVDSSGEEYHYADPSVRVDLSEEEKTYFIAELYKYAANLRNTNNSSVGFMRITPNSHLEETNIDFYIFLCKHDIKDISFAIVVDKNNHANLLGVVNPGKPSFARNLLEDTVICFSIAINNKKHLNNTEIAATTDSLTGVANRVSYKKDIIDLDEEKPEDFSCIYIDVNELHLRNNKYGHAAGDEMLIYIANTLKEVFYGQYVYRMGGDEFLVFAKNTSQETIKQNIETFLGQLKLVGYHVAIGMSYRTQNTNCEEMVREAEVKMYEAKAQYYQNKEQIPSDEADITADEYIQVETGNKEIDTLLSVVKEHYRAIYRVSLKTDNMRGIIAPSYLGNHDNENNFSTLFTRYVDDFVHPDFHRSLTAFLNYDAIRKQLANGKTPSIKYNKVNGEPVILKVYKLDGEAEDTDDTLWIFSK